MTIGDIAIVVYTILWYGAMGVAFTFVAVVLITWAEGFNHRRRFRQTMRRHERLSAWDMTGRRVNNWRR